jgi:hypothetical protein
MSEPSEDHSGSCLCGAVRFKARGRPLWVAHCHCQSCRRNTGSAVATFVGYRKDRLAYVAGAPEIYASSPGVTRSFCRSCGTPLTYQAERYPGEVHVYLCTLDRPQDFVPQVHVHAGEQLPWLRLADDLPRYHTTTRDAEPMS